MGAGEEGTPPDDGEVSSGSGLGLMGYAASLNSKGFPVAVDGLVNPPSSFSSHQTPSRGSKAFLIVVEFRFMCRLETHLVSMPWLAKQRFPNNQIPSFGVKHTSPGGRYSSTLGSYFMRGRNTILS